MNKIGNSAPVDFRPQKKPTSENEKVIIDHINSQTMRNRGHIFTGTHEPRKTELPKDPIGITLYKGVPIDAKEEEEFQYKESPKTFKRTERPLGQKHKKIDSVLQQRLGNPLQTSRTVLSQQPVNRKGLQKKTAAPVVSSHRPHLPPAVQSSSQQTASIPPLAGSKPTILSAGAGIMSHSNPLLYPKDPVPVVLNLELPPPIIPECWVLENPPFALSREQAQELNSKCFIRAHSLEESGEVIEAMFYLDSNPNKSYAKRQKEKEIDQKEKEVDQDELEKLAASLREKRFSKTTDKFFWVTKENVKQNLLIQLQSGPIVFAVRKGGKHLIILDAIQDGYAWIRDPIQGKICIRLESLIENMIYRQTEVDIKTIHFVRTDHLVPTDLEQWKLIMPPPRKLMSVQKSKCFIRALPSEEGDAALVAMLGTDLGKEIAFKQETRSGSVDWNKELAKILDCVWSSDKSAVSSWINWRTKEELVEQFSSLLTSNKSLIIAVKQGTEHFIILDGIQDGCASIRDPLQGRLYVDLNALIDALICDQSGDSKSIRYVQMPNVMANKGVPPKKEEIHHPSSEKKEEVVQQSLIPTKIPNTAPTPLPATSEKERMKFSFTKDNKGRHIIPQQPQTAAYTSAQLVVAMMGLDKEVSSECYKHLEEKGENSVKYLTGLAERFGFKTQTCNFDPKSIVKLVQNKMKSHLAVVKLYENGKENFCLLNYIDRNKVYIRDPNLGKDIAMTLDDFIKKCATSGQKIPVLFFQI